MKKCCKKWKEAYQIRLFYRKRGFDTIDTKCLELCPIYGSSLGEESNATFWSYRVFRYKDGSIGLHETYFTHVDNEDKPDSWTEKPIIIGGDVKDLLSQLKMMTKEIKANKKVLDFKPKQESKWCEECALQETDNCIECKTHSNFILQPIHFKPKSKLPDKFTFELKEKYIPKKWIMSIINKLIDYLKSKEGGR